eukprot:1161052-Pelagomonas_calceolata.AAC.2
MLSRARLIGGSTESHEPSSCRDCSLLGATLFQEKKGYVLRVLIAVWKEEDEAHASIWYLRLS